MNPEIMENIDPDENIFNELYNKNISNFCSISEFSNLCKDNPLNYTILNYNIRSFHANRDTFFSMFDDSCLPEIIVLTETWFKPENSFDIPNFNSYHTYRNSGRSGGVSLYIKNNLISAIVPELCISNETIEISTASLCLNESQIVIYAIYRPRSGTVLDFTLELSNIMNNSKVSNKPSIFLGDININILDTSPQIDIFMQTMYTYHFLPIITKPTRFPSNLYNPSLLDQIWTNRIFNYTCGIVLSDFTDHCPTFIRIPIKSTTTIHKKTKISFRCKNAASLDKFEASLRSFNWESLKSPDLNNYVSNFLESINSLYCKSFPLKTKYVSNKQLDNAWITPSLRNLIKAKSEYFCLFRQGIVSEIENNVYKNRVKTLVSNSKRAYFRKVFSENKNSMVKTWSLIKNLIGSNMNKSSIRQIIVNNIEYTDDLSIAELFSDYFSTVAPNLEHSLPQSNLNPLSFIQNSVPSTLFLIPVTIEECSSIIKILKLTKQAINNIPVHIFINFHEYYASVICNMINLSFSSGKFPNCLKCAYITLIFKTGERTSCQNYRPISVLPFLSKVFERCIYKRLHSFICKFSILSPLQFGFLRGKSTQAAVTELTECLYNALDEKDVTLIICTVLIKAFDTVLYEIRLRKF